jgi:hypothetical protein
MKLVVHLPRQSEAELEPRLKEDLVIRPKFYKKTGWVPVFHFTTSDAKNREERHVLLVSAATKQIKVEKLVEVIPACDKDSSDDDADGS